MNIANTPNPPYFAVIFTSLKSKNEPEYAEAAKLMEQLAQKQKGYLGYESAREGLGITVSYWESLDAIQAWKENIEHIAVQKMGRDAWYAAFKVRVCEVFRDYGFWKE